MYTILTRNNCKYCDKAKAILDLDRIAYVSYNIEEASSKWLLSLMKQANLTSVPQIFAHDGNYVGGYRQLESAAGLTDNREY